MAKSSGKLQHPTPISRLPETIELGTQPVIPNPFLAATWVDGVKLGVRGDVQIAMLTFTSMLPSGLTEVARLQTSIAHLVAMRDLLNRNFPESKFPAQQPEKK